MDTEMPDFDAIIAALDALSELLADDTELASGIEADPDAVLADELLGEGENL
jgi:hypothetical protein